MLTEKVAKLQDDVKKTQADIVHVKDQIHVFQEARGSRARGASTARENDVQRLASNVAELLSRSRYELAMVQQTVSNAVQDKTERTAEVAADQKALDAARSEVESLKATDDQLRERLASLREEFKKTLQSNVDILHRSTK